MVSMINKYLAVVCDLLEVIKIDLDLPKVDIKSSLEQNYVLQRLLQRRNPSQSLIHAIVCIYRR